jgi:alpha-ketoglutaric semialdehyde dehydrogenase
LGGNNAAIVWDDVDLPAAAADLAWGAFGFAGQRCTANRRVIVSEARCAALLEALIEATAALRWGDPLDADTVIGPVLTISRRDDLLELVAGAQADRVLTTALRPHQRARSTPPEGTGAYAPPTVVVCVDPRHAIVQEESMAPLLVVQPARDFDHALELCNGVRQGLVAALFSGSPEHQQQFLEQAQAGILKLNSSTAGVDPALPFGGWKASGLGPPEHGEGDAQFYCRLQAVYQADAPAPLAGRIRSQGTPGVG